MSTAAGNFHDISVRSCQPGHNLAVNAGDQISALSKKLWPALSKLGNIPHFQCDI